MSGREALRTLWLRVLNRGSRIVTLGRTTKVWVDEDYYAQLLAGAQRAEALERQIQEAAAATERAQAELATTVVDQLLADVFPGGRA